MSESPYRVPALEKGLDLLEALAGSPDPLTLTALAKAVGRNNNEIFRMLSCLEERGYLRRDAGGSYRLSLKLFTLVQAMEPVRELVRAAAPEMRQLSAEIGESCHLGVLEGCELVVIHRNEGPRPVRLAVEVGGRFPALRTVSGRLLLASLPGEELARALAGSAEWKKLGGTERKNLQKLLVRIAREGISTAVSETVEGVADAAVECGLPGTAIHASLAVSMLLPAHAKVDPRKFAGPLRQCANRIRQRLGGGTEKV
ncbi:MAG: IclR family transcriptional regulator [Terrimicrobiaceae bacterium]